MRRVVAAVMALLVLLSAAWGTWAWLDAQHGDSDADSAPERVLQGPGDTAGLGQGTGLARFENQTIAWEKCRAGWCSTMLAPLDYARPDGETIDLSLLKVEALDSPGDRTLLVNPGGPGASGKEYAQMSSLALGGKVARGFDVIGMDPRGVGDSTPVDCLSDEQLDAQISADPAPDTPAEVAALEQGVREMAAGCRALSGDLVDHVSTVEAARDMDLLRAILGEQKLNYFGASYGTKLGATYADLFPQRVGKFVLDAALDPTLSNAEVVKGQAQGFGRATKAWAADYVATCEDECPLGTEADEVVARVGTLLDKVAEEPVPAGTRMLTPGYAFYGVAMPLYNEDYWPMLTTALNQLATDNDGTALLLNADLYASRAPDGSFLDNSMEAQFAINCADDPTGLTAKQIEPQVAEFTSLGGPLGEALAWGMLGCGESRTQPKPELSYHAAGADPILVIGTTRDPATPYEWAVSLADLLDSGVLVSRDGDGHGGFRSGNDCVDDTVTDYLFDRATPKATVTC